MKNNLISLLVFGAVFSSSFLFGLETQKKEMVTVSSNSQLKWNAGPDVLPAGSEIAVLYGNPQESGPFGARLKFPANYRIAPHWHAEDENITVISGSLYLGMGEKFDESKGTQILEGGFASIPKKMGHYAWTIEPTVVQLNNLGPWNLIYYNLADDPRTNKKLP